ncbi:uncharacterized protein STEHIDRAFT_117200 [Stereum hirsutum FP-91666 SS1]|uniref:uncharacterized protein n=1 Tax=Stereum hirsutum (strain FP-91666) TaxID=721885 RepID=UPI000440B779|nr:uncharacterized protein STEHIDRAFT_117200 [Stereum hirsutum FP-91666 SS1]EIM92117.1 hypothetical protein STEHIDRAFT_117200 [Stereum hirsutum FP-91666 SS1]
MPSSPRSGRPGQMQVLRQNHSLATTRGVQIFVCLRRSSGHAGSCSISSHPRAGCLKLEAVTDTTEQFPGPGRRPPGVPSELVASLIVL